MIQNVLNPRHPTNVELDKIFATGGLIDHSVNLSFEGEWYDMRHFIDIVDSVSISSFDSLVVWITQIVDSFQPSINDFDGSLSFGVICVGCPGIILFLLLVRSLFFPIDDGIVQERFKNGQKGVAVVPERGHGGGDSPAEGALVSGGPKGIDHVGRESKGHHLRSGQMQALVEYAIKIDVNALPGRGVDENVFRVTIPQADDVPHGGPHGYGEGEFGPGLEPGMGIQEILHKPPIQERRIFFQAEFFEHGGSSVEVSLFDVHVLAFLEVVSEDGIAEVGNSSATSSLGMRGSLRIVGLANETSERCCIWHPFNDATFF